MKGLIFIGLFFCACHLHSVHAQTNNLDSLKRTLNSNINDSVKFPIYAQLFSFYLETNLDSCMIYARQIYKLSSQSKDKMTQIWGLGAIGVVSWRRGNTEKSIELLLKSLHIAEELKDSSGLSLAYFNLANAYNSANDDERAVDYYSKVLKTAPLSSEYDRTRTYMMLGSIYLKKNQPDSALFYAQQSYKYYVKDSYEPSKEGIAKYFPVLLNLLGNIQIKLKHSVLALEYYRRGISEGFIYDNYKAVTDNYVSMVRFFKQQNLDDSAYYYAKEAYSTAKQLNSPYSIEETSKLLKDIYHENNDLDSAFKYQEIMLSARDSILNIEKIRQVQNLSFYEEQRQQELETAKIEFQNKLKLYALLSGLIVFLIISFILYRNNRHRQKAYALLQKQKQEIDIQKTNVEQTLKELKFTQSQLIQSEKLASLGELAAGIAHEIQNPLNFVNNFTEVNTELIDEMKEELKAGKTRSAISLAEDVKQNNEKITFHGKRADGIVKGLLQHSRTSSGQKELTDINALADEYLRIAYHGLRAKDKTFNAKFEIDFDNSIGKINIIPQDIARVLVNLINNAFYAVSEKKKQSPGEYEATVAISTKTIDSRVEIKVKDNGNGIPQKVLDKIFQPFFTTKPTGQGTGLGLSLAYDIVKAHSGEILVQTEEGHGSEFTIRLPSK